MVFVFIITKILLKVIIIFMVKITKKRVNFNEHIKFNTSLNNLNGKFIQISDQLFLSTPKEHLPRSSFINFWFNRIFLRK